MWREDSGNGEVVQAGFIDEISFYRAGRSDVVVDRKGDLTPSDRVLAHYRAQVSTYRQMLLTGKAAILP